MEIKKGILQGEVEGILNWAFPSFNTVIDEENFIETVLSHTDWDISAKLVDEDNNIKGVYLIGTKQLSLKQYTTSKGVEGVMLLVDEDLRGQGWGNKLKDYPKTLNIDYIWGLQLKELNNLQDWLKRRTLVGEIDDCYVTLEDFRQ